jgi:asparagine synthase (glutamine-hydrolysing)
MAGIFGGISLDNYKFKEEKTLKHDELLFGKYTYGRKYIDKFKDERFILETEEYICVFEGFLFDIESTENQKDYFIKNLNYLSVTQFIKKLDGIFSLSILFKKEGKVFLVVDHLATMKIFYSQYENKLIFSSDLFDITNYYKNIEHDIDLDESGIYFFLGFGSVAADRTLFDNIKKLEASTYLEYDIKTHKYNVEKYHTLNFKENNKLIESEIIDKFEELISKPMNRIINLNDKYNLECIASLSGGLDSKSMVVMLKEKVKKLTTYTFAQYGTLDQSIAQYVSSKLGTIHNFISLDKGKCLEYNFENIIKATNGLASIHSFMHSYNSFINLNSQQFGLLVTGQIGDAIFGSHFIGSKTVKEYITSKSHYGKVPDFIYKKINFMNELIEKYSHNNSESYIYEGRISNGTIHGDMVIRNRIDTITPFYSKKLLNFSITVPEKYRVDGDIYLKWLSKYHPLTLKFKWDKCDCIPSSKLKVKFLSYMHLVQNAIKKRLRLKYDNMNPYDLWYRENKNILINLDNYFNEHIIILNFNTELQNDVIKLYNSDIDRYKRNKFVVITLLLSLKLHLKD